MLAIVAPPQARALTQQQVRQIVSTFAGDAVASGRAIGVGVGVVFPGLSPQTYAYGLADVATQTPFTAQSIVAIASTTKVFTTNLLGQDIAARRLGLSTTLAQLSAQLGTVGPMTGQVTLEELGSFSGGLPVVPPLCTAAKVPGCLPYARPTMADYGAADLRAFMHATTPADYTVSPPVPLAALPGPAVYSDLSIGLLGLLLGTPTGVLHQGSVAGWYDRVDTQILAPLKMTSTFLTMPASAKPRLAAGYAIAAAVPTVSGGALSAIQVTDGGGGYTSAPAVTIAGGGGSGATATATVVGGFVKRITVQSGGQNYLAPPQITFGAGKSAVAHGTAIVAHGTIVGVLVTDGGGGYASAPTVTVSGGRLASGSDAQLVAHVAAGAVTAVTVRQGGAGYLAPLTVLVAPSPPTLPAAPPIWAPAGALVSTTADLTAFAAAAVGRSPVNGQTVPAVLANGFEIAETPYVCDAKGYTLQTCGPQLPEGGLAWTIFPADTAHGVPAMASRTGGLNGYTNQIVLVPGLQLAVVVAVNSHGDPRNGNLGYHIAYALLYAMAAAGTAR